MSTRNSGITTDPNLIIRNLMPPDVNKLPLADYNSTRDSFVNDANSVFKKSEARLEELLMEGRLDTKEKKRVFSDMKNSIRELLQFNLNGDAYEFTIRYISIQQKYVIH